MIGKIFRHSRLRDSQVLCEPGLDRVRAATVAASEQVAHGNPQCLANLHVVIRRQVRIRENAYAWSGRRAVGIAKFRGRTGKQAAELHFEQGKPGGESGVPVAAFEARLRGISQRVQGQALRRSEEHTSELQSRLHLVCRLLLEKKKKTQISS